MQFRSRKVVALTHLLAFGLGSLIGVTVAARAVFAPWQPLQSVACRPSFPDRALGDYDGPVLLLWGNSLLFDNGWRDTGAEPVNCARQGLTAAQALRLTDDLPGPAPDTILVAFGSVEAVAATQADATVDAASFGAAVAAIISRLSARWPRARILLASVPNFTKQGELRPEHTELLNAELAGVAGAAGANLLDLSAIYRNDPAASYDGVHIAPRAYGKWEEAIRDIQGR